MDANGIVLDSVVRYPVKGLAGVPTAEPVRLESGRGLRWDRSLAIAHADSLPDRGGWRPREDFFHLARHEHIARMSVDLLDAETDAPRLTITAADGTSATGTLGAGGTGGGGEAGGTAEIDALLRDALRDERASPRLVTTASEGLWDWPSAHLSIINLSTLDELGREVGEPVDRRRFRGNLYLSGLPPFAEFDLVGQRIRIGDVELEVFQPTDRCRATTIRPGEGVSDLNVPALLGARYGHMFCGVYARVVQGGILRTGDAVEDTGIAVDPAPAGKREWPRTAHVVERVEESADVTSLWLTDPVHLLDSSVPGAHVRVHLPGEPTPNWRAYTISGTAPGRFRISVKCDGRVSTLLHDAFPVDARIVVTGPHGIAEADDGARDLLLVSAGIGITPAAALLRSRESQGKVGRVRVVHAERSAATPPLWAEVCRAVEALPDAAATLHITRDPVPAAASGFTVVAGRPDEAALIAASAGLDPERADAFVCGPGNFAPQIRDTLIDIGFAPDRIRVDAFYSPAAPDWGPPRIPRAEDPLHVDSAAGSFSWEPAAATLLSAAEQAGIDWPSECRVGVCGTCARTVAQGEFEYLNEPLFDPGPGRVLVCSAAPLTPLRLDSPLDASTPETSGAS